MPPAPKKPTEAGIRKALRAVRDPSQGKDIVELGLVSEIGVDGGDVRVVMEVPAHRGPALEPLRARAEEAVRGLEGVTGAAVMMTAHGPGVADAPAGEGGADGEDGRQEVLESRVTRFVAVASGKGGVGKSTAAANLAVAMRLEGWRVGLLDADVHGPSQPRMLGVSGKPPPVGGEMVAPLENYGVKLMSMGLLVPDDTAMIWRGPMVQSALTQMLNAVAWGELDVIVIDLPPGTGDIQISLAQQVNLSGAVIVSTPQDVALLDVAKAITMFGKAGVEVLGMVQNMAVWRCPDCGRVDHIFGEGGAAREARDRGIELLGEIPLSLPVRAGGDAGTPVVVAEPDSPPALAFREIARGILGRIGVGEDGQGGAR